MNVYISADIEGITGIVSWSQCSRPDGKSFDYAFARRMMTHDVNAAIRGARAGGATRVVVKDSHGNSKNLLVDELEPGTELITGHGSGTDGMMMGIDATFDAALLVGYHGMAGALQGVMEHTITGGVHRLWVNGELTGEMGLSAGVAGHLGIPLVFVSSDDAGCKEATALVPGVVTSSVKSGFGRYMAQMKHPSDTGPAIESAAKVAVKTIPTKPHVFAEPTTIRVEFNRAEEADHGMRVAAIQRVDGYTLEGQFTHYVEAHRAIWNLMALSANGIDAQW